MVEVSWLSEPPFAFCWRMTHRFGILTCIVEGFYRSFEHPCALPAVALSATSTESDGLKTGCIVRDVRPIVVSRWVFLDVPAEYT